MNKHEIQNLIKDLIEKTNISVKDISITKDDQNSIWYRVEVGEPRFFTDREGEALFALNHLTKRIIENKIGDRRNPSNPLDILIDINGYHQKKIDNIHAVAHMMAERARYFKSNIEIDPMSAFERKIVHEFLSNATDLKTESEGVGPSRRVVIRYIGAI